MLTSKCFSRPVEQCAKWGKNWTVMPSPAVQITRTVRAPTIDSK